MAQAAAAAAAAAQERNAVQDVNPFMQVLSPKARLSCSACSLLGKLLYPPGPLQIPLNPKRSHPLFNSPTSEHSANHLINSPYNHYTNHYANDLPNPPPNLNFSAPSSNDPAFTLDFTTTQPNITCHFDRLHKDLALHFQLKSDNNHDFQQPINNNSSANPSMQQSNSSNLSLQQSNYENSNPNAQSSMNDNINLNNLQPSRKTSISLQPSVNDGCLHPSMNDSKDLSLQPSSKNSVDLEHSVNDIINLNLQPSRKNSLSLQHSKNDGVNLNHEKLNHYADNESVNLSDVQPSGIKESYGHPSNIKVPLDHYRKPTLKVELFKTSEKGFGIRILQSLEASNNNSLEAKSTLTPQYCTTSPLRGNNAIVEKDGSEASSDINHPTTCSSPNLDHIRTMNGKFSPAQTDDSVPNSEMSGQQDQANDKLRCTCDSPCGDPHCGYPTSITN